MHKALDADRHVETGRKLEHSAPAGSHGGRRSKDKRYSGIRADPFQEVISRSGWAPDVGSSHPGAGEGPKVKDEAVKVARELGSERRETVRSLSVVGVEI